MSKVKEALARLTKGTQFAEQTPEAKTPRATSEYKVNTQLLDRIKQAREAQLQTASTT